MKIILDLCGGTGAWSKPYADAGYDVRVITLPEYDVIEYAKWFEFNRFSPYGILMAPPCDHFSVSGAQYWKQKDIDGRTFEALEIVDACLDIMLMSDPVFWALENPVGRLRDLRGHTLEESGKPLIFNPCDYAGYGETYYACDCGLEFEDELGEYGCYNCMVEKPAKLMFRDAYTKKTLLWGNFNVPAKSPVDPIRVCKQGSWVQKLGGKSEKTKQLRSITPPGFAKAFFEANR